MSGCTGVHTGALWLASGGVADMCTREQGVHTLGPSSMCVVVHWACMLGCTSRHMVACRGHSRGK